MIIETAEMIKKTCYNGSFVGRVSGDEFVIIVPNCSEATAQPLEDALRKSSIKLKGIHFNAAVGHTIVNDGKIDFEQAFSIAESCMYKNKHVRKIKSNKKIIEELIAQLHDFDDYYLLREDPLSKIIDVFVDLFKLDQEEGHWLHEASRYQDIGLVIAKENFKDHSEKTAIILNTLKVANNITSICMNHHEQYDGRGYPKGLKGSNIPKLSRLMTLANMVYDYNIRLESGFLTLSELSKEKGKAIDPNFFNVLNTKAFIEFLDSIR